MNADGGIQLSDLAGIARRRVKLAGFVVLLVVLAAYWLAMVLPNVYTSYATVLVEPQSVSPRLVQAGVADSNLNERLHLMTAQILSRARLSGIIDALSLYEEESKSMVRQDIIDLMRSRIRVEPVIPDLQSREARLRGDAEINQFRIFFEDSNPFVARDVAQRLAQSFIDTHIGARVETSEKSLTFVESELERLSTRIGEIEAEIAKVKSENAGSLPEEMDSNQRRLDRVLNELTNARRAQAEAASDENFFRSQLAASSFGEGGDSPARRLEALKLALGEYQSRGYTEKHPDVRRTRKEIEQLEKTLEGGAEEGEPTTLLAQQTEAQMRRAALRRTAAEEEITRLEAQSEEIHTLINATPAVAEKLEGLTRELAHLGQSFQDFSNRRLEASVQAQLERRQLGEQFRVLEAAFPATEPSAPNRVLIVVLGGMLALALGAGVALFMEVADTSAHDARHLQNLHRAPVLVSIPDIQLESDLARLRRKRLRTSLATAALVGFVLVGGAASYVWVNGLPGAPADARETGTTDSARVGS